jgi:hypothetical protein
MSQQKQKKGIFGAVFNLFQSKDSDSKNSDCCSMSFEEIEEEKEVDQETQSKEATNDVKNNGRQG